MLRRRQQLHGDVRGSVLCNYLRAGRSDPCPKHERPNYPCADPCPKHERSDHPCADPCPKHERPNHLWSDLCPNHGAYHNQPYSVAKPSA